MANANIRKAIMWKDNGYFGGWKRDNRRNSPRRNSRSNSRKLNKHLKFLLPGTTIVSDCWPSFQHPYEGYSHQTVTQSITCSDKTKGTHANTKEHTWRHLKIITKHKQNARFYLAQYMITTINPKIQRYLHNFYDLSQKPTLVTMNKTEQHQVLTLTDILYQVSKCATFIKQ
jgi:hypothetical protein